MTPVKFRSERLRLGLSCAELALILNKSTPWISQVETLTGVCAKRKPDAISIFKFEEVINSGLIPQCVLDTRAEARARSEESWNELYFAELSCRGDLVKATKSKFKLLNSAKREAQKCRTEQSTILELGFSVDDFGVINDPICIKRGHFWELAGPEHVKTWSSEV